MNEKNTEKLYKDFPKIFKEHILLRCGDGWFTLIYELCGVLQFNTDKNNYPQVVAEQIKEKFGGLRFYYTSEVVDCGENKEKYGHIRGAVGFAESMSYHICEMCGNAGKARGKCFLLTLCDECNKKY